MAYHEPAATVEGCIPLLLLPDHWNEALFATVRDMMDALRGDILSGVLTSKADVAALPLPAGCRLSFVAVRNARPDATRMIVE